MAVLQVIFTYAPFMNTLFGSASIPWALWLDILGVSLAAFVIIEIEKWIRRKLTP